MLFLNETDIGYSATVRHFALILSLWVLSPDVRPRDLMNNIPVFVFRGENAWSYEGDYNPQIVFGISQSLWEDSHMQIVRHSPTHSNGVLRILMMT
jgi:hypothetical protein